MALNAELLPPERLPQAWRHPDAEIDRYALSVDGAIVGSITLAHFTGDRAGWAWISMIKVDPAQRGRGYGVLLHELAVRTAARWLLVEHACSPDEQRCVDALRRRGWTVRDVPGAVYGGKGVWALIPPTSASVSISG